MPETARPDVDLNDLRIKEKSRAGSGILVRVLLLVLIPAAFAGGWFLRDRRGGSAESPDDAIPVVVQVVKGVTSGGAVAGGEFTEGGWVEVPSDYPIVVSALIPGRVDRLTVLEGAKVREGDVIAELYSRDLEEAVRLAQAEVERAAAELDLYHAGYRAEDVAAAAAEVVRIEAEVALAEKVLARTTSLVPEGVASEEEAERDGAALAVARARLTSAKKEHERLAAGYREEEVARAGAELKRAKAALDLAKLKLGYATVRSPADGVVFERFVTPGTHLSAGDPRIVSLYDPEKLQVRIDVRLENLSRVRVGMSARISTDVDPAKSYPGTVIRVEPLADYAKNTVQVKIRIDEGGPALHPEMICRARLGGADASGSAGGEKIVIRIPRTAVIEEGGKSLVFRMKEGRASRTEVELGESSGDLVAVESGLKEGDRLILAPLAGLEDGIAVREVGR